MSVLKEFAYAGGRLALGYLAWKAFAGSTQIWRDEGRGNSKTLLSSAPVLPWHLLFMPTLAEAAGGEVDSPHIVHPVDHVSPRIQFIEGTVTGIEPVRKTVDVKRSRNGNNLAAQQYQAEHIVIALGSVTNFHDFPDLARVAISMKKLEDAVVACDSALACLEQASTEEDPNNVSCQLVGYHGIGALGDYADVPHSNGKGSYAVTAQNATPAGKLVARNLRG